MLFRSTKDGSVWVGWQMRNDDWESLSKGDGEAISDDLGATWRPRRESDVITSGVRLPNGKAFKGFQTRYVLTCEAMKNYTPVLEHKGRRYHFLEDIKEYEEYIEECEEPPDSRYIYKCSKASDDAYDKCACGRGDVIAES